MNETHQSLEEILFNLAVQKATPAERADFLGHACRDNPTLRAAVEALLESHFGAAGFLPPMASGPGLPEAPTVPAPAAEAPAEMIGRYKLLEKIGEGGFGEVWMAEQREPVKRRVALKILKPGMDSRQVVALFLGLGVSIWQAVQKTRALARMTDAEHAQSRSRAVAEAALTQEAEARRRVDELLEQEKTQRLLAEKRIYATDVHLAQLAIDRDNFVRARELLSRHYPRPGQTNRPGWEWRYLWQQSQADAAMEAYRAPSHGSTHSDVSPDGRLLAVTRPDTGTASIDLVDITDLRNPRKAGGIASLQSNLVTAVAFNPRNGLLAHAEWCRSPDPDGATSTTLALHDATTGRPVGTITDLAGECRSLVWSGDGRSFWTLLLSGSPSRARLCLWRVPDLTLAASITNVPDQKVIGRHPFATTPDARTIAVAAGSGALTAIDVATGTTNWSIPSPHSYGFANVVLAPDDRTLFASEGATPAVIRTFDLLTGKEMAPQVECGENGGLSLAVAPDGRTLVSSSPEKLLRVWDVSDLSQGPKALPPLRGLPSITWSVHFLPDATKLLTRGLGGTVLAWDLTRDRRPRYPLVVPFDHAVVRYQIGTDSYTLWTAKTNGIVSQRSGDAFQSETQLFNLGRKLDDAQFSEDGRWFAAGSTRGTVEVWNVAERRRLHEFGSYGGRVEAVQFSQDGARLIVLDHEGATYAEWDLATSKQIRSFPEPDSRRRGQRRSLSRDDRILLTLEQSGTFTRMETRTLEQRAGDSGLPNAVSVAFTPDGGHFAISSFNGSAKVFDTETLEPIAILGGDAYYIAAHFLDQGGRLMLAGDRTRHAVGVWDVGTRLELLRLEAEGFHRRLGASPDGNLLVAGVEETLDEVKELRLWRAPSAESVRPPPRPPRGFERRAVLDCGGP